MPSPETVIFKLKLPHVSHPRILRHPSCLSSGQPSPAVFLFWSKDTEARRYRAVKTIVCLIFREGEATTAPSPPVLVAERRKFRQLRRRQFKLPGSEGYVSLTSPVSGSRFCLFVQV